MKLTAGERRIIRNQTVIMQVLSALLHAPGVSSGGMHVELTRNISKSLHDLQQDEEAEERRHGRRTTTS